MIYPGSFLKMPPCGCYTDSIHITDYVRIIRPPRHERINETVKSLGVIYSGNNTDQACLSPASRPNSPREGFSHGSASKAFATSAAAGEK